MNKILSWIIGLALGASVGALLVMLFVPATGDEITQRLKDGFDDTLREARLASEKRRAELEAELRERQNRRLPEASDRRKK